MGFVSFAATSGLFVLASRFVERLSLPHITPDELQFTFKLPASLPEAPLHLWRAITFRTADGKVLRGDFWAQPQPAPTVIVCHGYRVTREVLRPVAAMEYAHGYNILLFDFRGHGDSESVATSGGRAEVSDLEAAINVAVLQPETLSGKLILHGFSMGAAVALLMQPHPEVAAIVADSPYANLEEILRHLIEQDLRQVSQRWQGPWRVVAEAIPLVSWGIMLAGKAVYLVRFRHPLGARPEASLRNKQTRKRAYPPILLIHGLDDLAIPVTHARRLAACARAQNIPLSTFYVAGANHCAAYGLDPSGYIQACRTFLQSALTA